MNTTTKILAYCLLLIFLVLPFTVNSEGSSDLIISNLSYTNLPPAGDDPYAYFNITIKNQGTQTAKLTGGILEEHIFCLTIYNSTDGETYTEVGGSCRGKDELLNPQAETEFSNVFTYRKSNWTNAKKVKITLDDSANVVHESNECNNSMILDIASGQKTSGWDKDTYCQQDPIPPADTTPPTINNVSIVQVSETQIGISWTTNEDTVFLVDFGNSAGDYHLFGGGNNKNYKKTHSYSRDTLETDKKYHFQITAIDSSSNTTRSSDFSFTLSKNQEPPVIVPTTISNKPSNMAKRLSGRLLLSVEDNGKVWYVDDNKYQRHNITWDNALALFENFALGITDENLLKIPASVDSIKPDLDTDEDGYTDRSELTHGFSPYTPGAYQGKFSIDTNLANRLKGKLLLQVNQKGAIWYVDQDGKRHSVRWDNLMDLSRKLALGINNNDLEEIEKSE